MCASISALEKALPAPQLRDGCNFAFDGSRNLLISKDRRPVEIDVAVTLKYIAVADVMTFKEHVGRGLMSSAIQTQGHCLLLSMHGEASGVGQLVDGAPKAMVRPSDERDTERPTSSNAASP